MFCSKCGSVISEGSKFCSVCGENLQQNSNNNYSIGEQPTVFAGSEQAQFNNVPVYQEMPQNSGYAVSAVNSDNKPEKKKKEKKKGPKKVILSIVAVILALVIVAGSGFGIFCAQNPELRLLYAVQKTLLDSKGFNFSFCCLSESRYYKDSFKASGIVDFEENTEKTNIYFSADENWECKGYYDEEYDSETDSFVDVYVEPYNSFNSYYGAIYNGTGVIGATEGEDNIAYEGLFFKGTTEDLFSELERSCEDSPEIKDGLKEYADLTVDEVFVMARSLISKEKINMDVIKQLFNGSLAHFMDEEFGADMLSYTDTVKLIVDFFVNGITEEAFKITKTYREDGIKKYDVRLDLNELMICLDDYIDDHDEVRDLLDDIDPEICEGIECLADEEEFEEDFRFTIGTKNGYFCSFESDFSGEFDVELRIMNINNPSDVASYYKDVETIAGEWKESFYTVKTYEDVENAMDDYYNRRYN